MSHENPRAPSVPLEKLPREHAAIAVLAELACEDDPAAKTERVWLIVPKDGPRPKPGSLLLAGGPPIGVDETTRPSFEGAFMHHLLTIDLDRTPELRRFPRFAEARAFAVFMADHEDNDASRAGTKETAVVALSESDLKKGDWKGPDVNDPPRTPFDLIAIDVPVTVFDAAKLATTDAFDFNSLDAPATREDDRKKLRATLRDFALAHAKTKETRVAALRAELMNNDHLGGQVIHFAKETYETDFIGQITEDLLPELYLGDAGTFYVFAETAFWIGH